MPAERGDPALGVFETLRVQDGRLLAAAAHLGRLGRSLRSLYALAPPPGLAAELAARAAPLSGAHRLRVDAIPDGDAITVTVTVSPLPRHAPAPVRAAIVTVPGGLGPDKLRDREGLGTLAPAGVTALIADADGSVLEAAWGNLWLREGDRLITPPADGRLLPGVTRGRLLALAPRLGLTAGEETVSRERLERADAILLTSALRLAVAATLDRPPDSEPPWLEAIRAALGDHWQSGASER